MIFLIQDIDQRDFPSSSYNIPTKTTTSYPTTHSVSKLRTMFYNHFLFCFFLLVLCFLIPLNFCSLALEPFLLCNKNRPHKHFAFAPPMNCQPQHFVRSKECKAEIFSTQSTLKPVRAYFCFTKQTHWTSHFFFFGSKYKETHVVDSQPPSPLSCKSWSSTKAHEMES